MDFGLKKCMDFCIAHAPCISRSSSSDLHWRHEAPSKSIRTARKNHFSKHTEGYQRSSLTRRWWSRSGAGGWRGRAPTASPPRARPPGAAAARRRPTAGAPRRRRTRGLCRRPRRRPRPSRASWAPPRRPPRAAGPAPPRGRGPPARRPGRPSPRPRRGRKATAGSPPARRSTLPPR